MSSDARRATASAAEFIEAVLRVAPRVAVFDADGTLWAPDSGEEFFYWEVENGLMPAAVARWAVPRYEDYRRGLVGEAEICGEMVALHAGMPAATLERAAEEFFRERVEPRIFCEMQKLAAGLLQGGCDLWAVSSTNEWVVRAGTCRFGIADDHVLATAARIENGIVTDRLLRVPTDSEKAVVLREVLVAPPDAAFGNSLHDLAMLEMARNAFVVNPNPDLTSVAGTRGWLIYHPEALGQFR